MKLSHSVYVRDIHVVPLFNYLYPSYFSSAGKGGKGNGRGKTVMTADGKKVGNPYWYKASSMWAFKVDGSEALRVARLNDCCSFLQFTYCP